MKNSIQRVLWSLLTAAFLLSVVTGCRHTARGAGEDIEDMGEKIQEKTR